MYTTMDTTKLESLILLYTAAAFDEPPDMALIDRLANEVEAEADRVNYTNHRRLMALHTQAERASLRRAP